MHMGERRTLPDVSGGALATSCPASGMRKRSEAGREERQQLHQHARKRSAAGRHLRRALHFVKAGTAAKGERLELAVSWISTSRADAEYRALVDSRGIR